jgi:mannan endo-1,4-beta-mannosidase
VKDGALYDVNCVEFVMRGVNYPYAWFSTRNTQQDLQAIAATGANAVRIVLATGGRWTKTSESTLTSLIGWAKAAKLVSILEVHDTTGYSEQAESVPLSNATSYWTGSDIVSALKGQEAFVIVNVGNEPNGNDTSTDWAPSHVTAVQALRTAGLEHTLMVDAPNWGQDWENRMRDGGGSSIWDADTRKNLMFSVHMYDVYASSATVTSYFNNFLMKYEAPLVVGEFAADHGSTGNVDEDTILSLAESLSVGYLGWSWSGNGSGLETLDITTNFESNTLTTWGTRLIRGMNGIEATQLIRKFSPGSKILGVSLHTQPTYARKMIQKGAMGYVTKNSSREEMFKAIMEVQNGRKYICDEIKNILSEQVISGEDQQGGLNSLSQREIEIIAFIKKGHSSKEIADSLNISVKTVEVHRYNILKKLNLKNAAALVNFINNSQLDFEN